MKWIVLMALVACGNKEPAAVYPDHDGDGVASTYEVDTKKYIAEYRSLPKIEGQIKIKSKSGKEFALPFSTDTDVYAEGTLVLGYKSLPESFRKYFSEFSKVRLLGKLPEQELNAFNIFQISFEYETENKEDLSVTLVRPDQERVSSHGPGLFKDISKEDLLSIMEGTSYFKFERNEIIERQEQIRNHSNRIYFHDGKNSKVIYMAKILSLPEIFHELKVDEALDASSMHLLDNERTGWWYKDHGTVKSIHWGTRNELLEKFYALAPKETGVLARVEGAPQNALTFAIQGEGKQDILIRLKNLGRVRRQFATELKKQDGKGGRGENLYNCDYQVRWVAAEKKEPITEKEIFEQLIFELEGKEIHPVEIINKMDKVTTTEGKEMWEMGLAIQGEQMNIRFRNFEQTDMVGRITPQTDTHCWAWRQYFNNVNTEARWQFQAEIYQDL